LTGDPGADTVEGIKIRYTGETHLLGGNAGTVTFSQNSLTFQIGAEANQFSEYSLGSIKTNDLGRGEENSSNFDSLAQIKVLNSEQAQDAIRVIDKAIQEVNPVEVKWEHSRRITWKAT